MLDAMGNVSSVIRGIRRRATFARISALVMVGSLTIIGIAIAVYFVQAVSGPTISIGPQNNLANANIQFSNSEWVTEVTKAFVRVAGVIMAVFLINILVSFAKYNMRIANYLDSRADAIEMTDGSIEQLVALIPAISVDVLDFVKTPMSPFDTYFETVRGILPGRTGQTGNKGEKPKPDE